MRRRQVLVAAALLLPGCVSSIGPGDGERSTPTPDPTPDPSHTETPNTTPTGTPAPQPTLEIGEWGKGARVESVAVQREFVCHHTWREHHVVEGAQFLVVSADGASDWDFRAVLDGERVGREPPEGMVCDRVLPVPAGDYDSGVVEMEDGPAWELTDDHLAALEAAPDFRLRSAAVTEDGDETVLEIEVENVGDREGAFRGIVVSDQHADYDHEFTLGVPAGERVSHTVRDPIVEAWNPEDELLGEVTAGTRRFVVGYA